jgi:hypothetical protein
MALIMIGAAFAFAALLAGLRELGDLLKLS